ncbi:MAG: hypothetical protein K1Y36_10805 [Blastocatellia bacterium]|nr:hypothetical protein [Blastocatellia bacterium]
MSGARSTGRSAKAGATQSTKEYEQEKSVPLLFGKNLWLLFELTTMQKNVCVLILTWQLVGFRTKLPPLAPFLFLLNLALY